MKAAAEPGERRLPLLRRDPGRPRPQALLHELVRRVPAVPERPPGVISSATTLVGVIGDPVAHSLSPRMQNAAFAAAGLDWAYVPLRVAPDRLADALRGLAGLSFAGANVTIPHKEGVAALVDETTDVARAAGSREHDRRPRRRHAARRLDRRRRRHRRPRGRGRRRRLAGPVLVLGAGGSARAVISALTAAGAEVGVWSRRPEAAQALATALGVAAHDRLPSRAAARDRQLHAARRREGAHGVAGRRRFPLRCPRRLRPRLPPRRRATILCGDAAARRHRRGRRARGARPAGRALVRDLDRRRAGSRASCEQPFAASG